MSDEERTQHPTSVVTAGESRSPGADPPCRVTDLLHAWQQGQAGALDRLLPRVLDELRGLAGHYLARERHAGTLQPTALVNEVYLRLVGHRVQPFADRSAFFAFAARLMREILVDHARAKRTQKRGGTSPRLALDEAVDLPAGDGELDGATILAVDEAITRLGTIRPRHRQVVELRYFVGLTVPEIARALGISRATVERDWSVARRWLAGQLADDGSS